MLLLLRRKVDPIHTQASEMANTVSILLIYSFFSQILFGINSEHEDEYRFVTLNAFSSKSLPVLSVIRDSVCQPVRD